MAEFRSWNCSHWSKVCVLTKTEITLTFRPIRTIPGLNSGLNSATNSSVLLNVCSMPLPPSSIFTCEIVTIKSKKCSTLLYNVSSCLSFQEADGARSVPSVIQAQQGMRQWRASSAMPEPPGLNLSTAVTYSPLSFSVFSLSLLSLKLI